MLLKTNSRPVYRLIPDHLYHPEIGWYNSYGIHAFYGPQTTRTIHDVSVIKVHVELIVDKLNREKVELVHFQNVVEDYLDGISF